MPTGSAPAPGTGSSSRSRPMRASPRTGPTSSGSGASTITATDRGCEAEVVASDFAGTYPARTQPVRIGSALRVRHPALAGHPAFRLVTVGLADASQCGAADARRDGPLHARPRRRRADRRLRRRFPWRCRTFSRNDTGRTSSRESDGIDGVSARGRRGCRRPAPPRALPTTPELWFADRPSEGPPSTARSPGLG